MTRYQNPRTTPLAQWLDAAMKAKGYSQRRLAEAAGVSQPRITQILGGGGTRRDTLEALVAALFLGDPASEPGRYQEFEDSAIRAAWPTGRDEIQDDEAREKELFWEAYRNLKGAKKVAVDALLMIDESTGEQITGHDIRRITGQDED